MWNRFRQKNPIARSVTQLLALILVAAGCSGTSGSGQSGTATYSITVHQRQQTNGLGPPTDRIATLTATMQERRVGHANELVFTSVDGQGDGGMVAVARTLEGQTFSVAGTPSQVTLDGPYDETGGAFDTGVGILNPAESALSFQLLAPTTARSRSVTLLPARVDAGSRMAVPVNDLVTGLRKERGIATEQVTTTAVANRQLPPSAAYVRDTGGDTYTADVTFQQLFGAPQAVATPTEEGTITVPGYSYGSFGGGFSGFIGGLACIFTLGFGCPASTTVTVPPTQTPGLVPVPGPANLMTSVNANILLTSSHLVARRNDMVLSATGSGHMELKGSLPAGAGIPAALAGKTETLVSTVTYSSRLVSPWPRPTRSGPDLAVQLAGILALLLVGTATLVLATSGYRRSISRR